MVNVNSSYQQFNYGKLLESLVLLYRPNKIVEFGILEGYSLNSFCNGLKQLYPDWQNKITAYDIFDRYQYRKANFNSLKEKFGNIIQFGDFWTSQDNFTNNSIDILHIDISNTGDIFKHTLEKYLPKVSLGGILLLEGGSQERDNIDWMIKFNKKPIVPILESSGLKYIVFQPYPSLTLIIK